MKMFHFRLWMQSTDRKVKAKLVWLSAIKCRR